MSGTLPQVLRRTWRSYRPIKTSHACAWSGLYFYAPAWFYRPERGSKAVARWLGPTQVFAVVFDPCPTGFPGRAAILVGAYGGRLRPLVVLWRSRNWWKLDGRRLAERRRAKR